jgi:WD40 repeat protein
MRAARVHLAILLTLLFLVSSWPVSVQPLSDEVEVEWVPDNTEMTWNQPDRPGWDSGWTPQLWQPQPTGWLWEVDFSPDGEKIAAVDISTGILTVWNATDGRTLFHADHSNILADVLWLDASHVMAADVGSNWYSYEIIDDGGGWPMNSTTMRTGKWGANLTGNYPGSLWGLDTNRDRSRLVICGDIDDPNIGGEVIVADVGFFINGTAANSAHVYTTDWGTDCAISNDAIFAVSLSRIADTPTGPFRDTVTGWDVLGNTLAEAWHRNVAGGEAKAMAIDISMTGQTYTIAYNRPNEGVVADYFVADGAINWFAPNPQNVSSLRWSPDNTILGVGLVNPGRLFMLDGAGIFLGEYGWHSYVDGWGGPHPADVTAVAVDDQGTRFATVGKDSTVEIHTIDGASLSLKIQSRFGASLMREIEAHPTLPFIAFAESSGVATVKDTISGRIVMQCFHPDFDQVVGNPPYAKSVVMSEQITIVGFSDGVISACGEDGKQLWEWRISDHHQIDAFGRIDLHPIEGYLAMSWTQNVSQTGTAGKVAILDLDHMTEAKTFDYMTPYWTMEFSANGAWLASAGQDGTVRQWQTDDPDAALWSDSGVQYSHANYTGVVSWHSDLNVLMSAGWDGQAIVWDADIGQQMLNFQFDHQAFGAAFSGGSFLIIASGDYARRTSGQIEFYDGLNMTQLGVWPVPGIPRGLAMPDTGGIVVANDTGSWWVLIPDSDGDGIVDEWDLFPYNPLQWADADGDGFGDNNAPGAGGDGCPNVWGTSTEDRGGCPDTDGDQWSDPDEEWPACVLDAGWGDAWPSNPEQWCDADGDGHGDEHLFEVDEATGLRMNESGDAFPADASQWRDRDGDQIGDNHTFTLGADGLRVDERGDAFPSNPMQNKDTDGDGWGDAYSFTLGLDGLRLEVGDAFFLDPLAWSDLDGDGCPTASDTGLPIDNHPDDPSRCTEPLDFDLPGQLNLLGVGAEESWAIAVDWKLISESTDRIHLYGLNWNSSEGMAHLVLNLEPPGAIPWHAWDTFSTESEIIEFTRNRGEGQDRLTLRLVAWSTDDQMLDSWANFTYDDSRNDPVDPPIVEEPEPEPDPTSTSEGDDSPLEGLSPVAWIGLSALALTLLIVGALMLRRKGATDTEAAVESAFDDAPPASGPLSASMLAPCTECAGPAQETIHNGDRWTWCPSCRKWLSYLGKG